MGYYDKLKELIETTRSTYGRKVNLLASSMGGPVSHYFLTKYSGINQDWKDEYIANYITLMGAWTGGNNFVLQMLLTGLPHEMFGLIFGDPLNLIRDPLRKMSRTWESLLWLAPNSAIWGDKVLVKTKKRDYTAAEFKELFQEGNLGDYAYERYMRARDLSYDNSGEQPAPKVPTHCFYGGGQPTPIALDYTRCKRFPYDCKDSNVIIEEDPDGDGIVTKKGATVCEAWRSQEQPFSSRMFKDSHQAPSIELLEAIGEVITAGIKSDKRVVKGAPAHEDL